MPRIDPDAKPETLTFRIAPALKTALAETAERESKPVGEILRERVERARRRAFEAEARRQSLEAEAAARNPHSDEAAVMRALAAELGESADEWR